MRILIDMLTPKQVLFLGELSNRLEKAGHRVVKVTRSFAETVKLLRMRKIKAEVIGTHRTTLDGKLRESLIRTARIARLMRDKRIELVVAYPSVEASRSAFGLRIPYYCVSDSPHAEEVSRLSIPLASKLFSPAVIPLEDWNRYCLPPSKIIQYDALDPYVWVRDARPDPEMLKRHGLKPASRIVTLRIEESFAAYLMNMPGDWRTLGPRIAEELLSRGCPAEIVVLPRYREHHAAFRRLRGRIILPKAFIYGPSLLASTSVFIGGGGTMTAEAAMMGIPAISYFPAGPTRVEAFLQQSHLLARIQDPESIAEQAIDWLEDDAHRNECRARAQRLMEGMEDPIEKIVDNIGSGA
ncbi:DUF354 domain-containing protein [Candidatus Bathyarchaeota archaeon]|nr:DUF354 domain-containing protein [Candidatus Bathyarchaeota archaeon]